MHNPHNLPNDYELVFEIITRHYLLSYYNVSKTHNHNYFVIQSS